MLSTFLQKLDFVHQFKMTDGAIGVLGVKQAMLPASILDSLKGDEVYSAFKEHSQKEFKAYLSKIGETEEGKVHMLEKLYNTMGIGKLHVLSVDGSKAVIELHESPIADGKNVVLRGVIAGASSVLLKKSVDAHFKARKGSTFAYSVE